MPLSAASATPPLRWQAWNPVKTDAKFLPLLRQAVAVAPDRADFKLQLAKALFQNNRMAEIVDWLNPATADDRAKPELLYCLGRAAMATGDYQRAADALRSAVAAGFAPAFGYLAEALARLGRIDEALEAGLAGLRHSPANSQSLLVVTRILVDRGEVDRLWALCVELRACGAWGGWLPAVMASAAAALGLEDELDLLVDRSRWFSATRLGVPDDFNDKLVAELLEQRSRLSANAKTSTTAVQTRTDRLRLAAESFLHKPAFQVPPAKAGGGPPMRLDRLEHSGGPMAQELLIRVRDAVETYVADRRVFSDHPMIAHCPASVALAGWGLVVHHDRHQSWHIHQIAWISGVYYVTVPKLEPDAGERPGAIEFGLFPFGQQSQNLRSHRWQLIPEPGLLLLFPSYYAHRTWPTGTGDPRISVAFDIRPPEAAADEFS